MAGSERTFIIMHSAKYVILRPGYIDSHLKRSRIHSFHVNFPVLQSAVLKSPET